MKLLATLVAVAVTTIACGGPAPVPQVEDATATTLQQSSARTYTKQVMDFADAAQGVLTMESRGVVDFKRVQQRATTFTSGEGGESETIAAQLGKMKVVSEGFVTFVKAPLVQELPGPKDWLVLNLETAGEDTGSFLTTDAAHQLTYLHGIEDVDLIAREDVRGVPTTRFQGRGTFDALRDELPNDATIDRLQERMKIDAFEVDVWIDAKGLVRRMQFRYGMIPLGTAIPLGSASVPGTWTFTLEYYDFGVPVEIEFPPPNKVMDINELREQLDS